MAVGDQLTALLIGARNDRKTNERRTGEFAKREPAVTKPNISPGLTPGKTNGVKTNGEYKTPSGRNALLILSLIHVDLALDKPADNILREFKDIFLASNVPEKIEIIKGIRQIMERRKLIGRPCCKLELMLGIAKLDENEEVKVAARQC